MCCKPFRNNRGKRNIIRWNISHCITSHHNNSYITKKELEVHHDIIYLFIYLSTSIHSQAFPNMLLVHGKLGIPNMVFSVPSCSPTSQNLSLLVAAIYIHSDLQLASTMLLVWCLLEGEYRGPRGRYGVGDIT